MGKAQSCCTCRGVSDQHEIISSPEIKDREEPHDSVMTVQKTEKVSKIDDYKMVNSEVENLAPFGKVFQTPILSPLTQKKEALYIYEHKQVNKVPSMISDNSVLVHVPVTVTVPVQVKEPVKEPVQDPEIKPTPKPIEVPIVIHEPITYRNLEVEKKIEVDLPKEEEIKAPNITRGWKVNLRPEDKISLYDQARDYFEHINLIRAEPFKYFGKLKKIIDSIKLDENKKPFIKLENCTYKFKETMDNIKTAEVFLTSLSPVDPQLLEDIRHTTLWSEKIYNNCQSHLKNPSEDEKSFLDRVAKNYQFECESIRVFIDGLMDPETASLIFLIDNLKDRSFVFTHSFDVGSSASIKTNDERRIRTVLVLVDIIYPGERERRAGKEVKEDITPSGPSLSLDHPAFDSLAYKDKIVDGDFQIEGNSIKAFFVLESGEKKEETINM